MGSLEAKVFSCHDKVESRFRFTLKYTIILTSLITYVNYLFVMEQYLKVDVIEERFI